MKRFLLISLTICLAACNNSQKIQIAALQDETVILKDSIRLLNELIDGYRLSPQKLCANLDKLYNAGDLEGLIEIRSTLEKYHPEAKEITVVSDLCSKITLKQQREKEEAEKKRLQAVSKLNKKYGDITGITWYKNPYFSHNSNSNNTSIYIGYDGSRPWLRLDFLIKGLFVIRR